MFYLSISHTGAEPNFITAFAHRFRPPTALIIHDIGIRRTASLNTSTERNQAMGPKRYFCICQTCGRRLWRFRCSTLHISPLDLQIHNKLNNHALNFNSLQRTGLLSIRMNIVSIRVPLLEVRRLSLLTFWRCSTACEVLPFRNYILTLPPSSGS